jgi:DnaK suppressor protein
MKMLEQSQKEYFKELLNSMFKEALLGKREGNKGNIELVDHADPSDRATAELEINFNFRIWERNKGLIRKIEQALEKIDNNTFGICEECEEDIPEARLKARPVTTLCIDCKRRQEADEAIMGI